MVRAVLEPDRLELEIVDDGSGVRDPPSEGGGLQGMRERVTALAGGFSAHARPEGGFRGMGFASAGDAMSVRVVLADDQALIRVGLRALIDAEPDIEVVGEASDGEEALRVVREQRPDVVVMDIRMPVLDGLEATRLIAADPQLSSVRVLVLTTFEIDEYVFEALRAGAGGFLLKDAEPTELLRAIRVVAAGDSLLSPAVTRRVIEAFSARPAPVAPRTKLLVDLTAREREVVALAGCGLSNDEIAERLVISPATARTHVSRSMQKLGARDRAQLVVFAYESGLVSPGQALA
jgi:DNA-binding NarL/FixJ family response regulator